MAPTVEVNKRDALERANLGVSKSLHRRQKALSEILGLIAPGESFSERCRRVGVSRQTMYDWLSGKSRPNRQKARRLSQLTGIPAEEFRP